jgi:ACS family hexuronate transporter-like MFS transporter
MTGLPPLRWVIVALLFLASVLNYVDRQALSLLAPTIQRDLHLTDEDYASILNWFLVAYTVASLLSGRLVDKFGVRAGLAFFVGWWSIANIFTAFARSAASLGFFRFCLGLGEAGNWTAAPKAVAEWFPARERGLAVGLYTLGATIGATLAPLLVIGLATRYGWQAAFVVTGAAGLLWLIPWLWLYRRPNAEAVLAAAGEETPVADWGPWWRIIARREVWLLIFGRMLTDPVWYFFQFWFAKYLFTTRGLDQQGLSLTWVVYLAADFGALAGGWFSGRLIARRIAPVRSRLWVMLICAGLVPAAAAIPSLGSLGLVLALGMVAVFAHLAWLINLSALVVDLVPRKSLGFTFGLVATGSALGGLLMNRAVGALVTEVSYDPAFAFMLLLHPLAWVLLWQLRPRGPIAPAPSLPAAHAA